MTKTSLLRASVLLVLVAGCVGEAESSPFPTSPTPTSSAPTTSTAPSTTGAVADFPVTVPGGAGSEVVIESRPQRIAALSSVHVEILFAIGAGPQVVASDLFSNYPPEAAELVQVDSFNLSVESVVDLEPDLVLLSFDPGDAVAAFEAVGIPTLLLGTAPDLETAYSQITTLGRATGHAVEAGQLVTDMQRGIAAVVAEVGSAGTGLTFYHETDPFDFYTPSSQSFIGRLYELLGMVNIADAAPDEFGSGFPQLSPEFIVDADPQLVFVAAFGEDATTIGERPGWGTLTAVRESHIYSLDPDVASRWGPRVVELVAQIGDAVLDYRGEG